MAFSPCSDDSGFSYVMWWRFHQWRWWGCLRHQRLLLLPAVTWLSAVTSLTAGEEHFLPPLRDTSTHDASTRGDPSAQHVQKYVDTGTLHPLNGSWMCCCISLHSSSFRLSATCLQGFCSRSDAEGISEVQRRWRSMRPFGGAGSGLRSGFYAGQSSCSTRN